MTGGAAGLIGTVLSGRYRLEAEIGAGGMSTVYVAHDETLDRRVAIKLLHREMSSQPDQLERFAREARTVARISHPNVVTVIDAGEDGGRPYIVLEYVEGETLKQRIRRLGKLPPAEAVAYAIEIGRALHAAHEEKLIHRDVKPQNVLIGAEGGAKVTDFGIARSLEADGLTAAGRVLGTTDYVAPEQALGHDIDRRSDLYSLGVVLYEMLTGDVPFTAETPVAVAMRHVRETVPDVQKRRPEVSAVLAAIVEQATAKEAGNRYETAAAMVEDLEQALAVEAARAGSTSGEATTVLESIPSRGRFIRRYPGISLTTVAVLLAAGAIALAVVGLTGEGEIAPPGVDREGASELEISSGASGDYDPLGDGREHPAEVELAIDGDPTTTAWSTETYRDRALGGKGGVGLFVDMGTPVAAKAMQVRALAGGWDFEVRGASGESPPGAVDGWTVLGQVEDAGKRESVELTTGATSYRYYLIWITRLAPADGAFRVEISDIKLFG